MVDSAMTRVMTLKDEIAKGGFGPVPNETIPGYEIKSLVPMELACHRINLASLGVGFHHYAHAHVDAQSIIVFLEGQGEFLLGGDKSVPVKPGSVAVSVAGQLHGVKNIGDVPMHYFTVEGPIPRDGSRQGRVPAEQALPAEIPGVVRVQSLQALIDDWD